MPRAEQISLEELPVELQGQFKEAERTGTPLTIKAPTYSGLDLSGLEAETEGLDLSGLEAETTFNESDMDFFNNHGGEAKRVKQALIDAEAFGMPPTEAYDLQDQINEEVGSNSSVASRRLSAAERVQDSWDTAFGDNGKSFAEKSLATVKAIPDAAMSAWIQINKTGWTVHESIGNILSSNAAKEILQGRAGKYLTGTLAPDWAKQGRIMNEYLSESGKKYAPSEDIQGSIIDTPSLLADPEWWTYYTTQATGSMLPSFAIAKGNMAFNMLKTLSETEIKILAKKAATSGAIVGGLQEGASTYEDALKQGDSPQKASAKAGVMSLASAYLNRLSLSKILDANPKLNAWVKHAGAGATESFTEYLEEPTEGLILGENLKQIVQRAKQGVNVIPTSLLTGTAMSIASGVEVGKPKEAPTPEPSTEAPVTMKSQIGDIMGDIEEAVVTPEPVTKPVTPTAEAMPAVQAEAKPIITADELYKEVERYMTTKEYEQVFDLLDERDEIELIQRQSPEEYQRLKDRLTEEELTGDQQKKDMLELLQVRLEKIRQPEPSETIKPDVEGKDVTETVTEPIGTEIAIADVPILTTAKLEKDIWSKQRKGNIKLYFDAAGKTPTKQEINLIMKNAGLDGRVHQMEPNPISVANGEIRFEVELFYPEGVDEATYAQNAFKLLTGQPNDIQELTTLQSKASGSERFNASMDAFAKKWKEAMSESEPQPTIKLDAEGKEVKAEKEAEFKLSTQEGRTVEGVQPKQVSDLFTKQGFMDKMTEEEVKAQAGEPVERLAGELELPIKEQTGRIKVRKSARDVFHEIRSAGGINYNREGMLKGEIDIAIEHNPRLKFIVNKKGEGLPIDGIREMLVEEGYLHEDADLNDVMHAITINLKHPTRQEELLEKGLSKQAMGQEIMPESLEDGQSVIIDGEKYTKETDKDTGDTLLVGKTTLRYEKTGFDFVVIDEILGKSGTNLDFFGLQSTYEALYEAWAAGKPQQAFQDLLDMGQHVYQQGKTKASDFIRTMKEYLGEMWEKYKPYVLDVWQETKKLMKSEEGAIINPFYKLTPDEQEVADYLSSLGKMPTEEQYQKIQERLKLTDKGLERIKNAIGRTGGKGYKTGKEEAEPILTKEEANLPPEMEVIETFKKPQKHIIQDVKAGVDRYIGLVSTRVKNINVRLLDKLRKHVFDKIMQVDADTRGVIGFIEKFSKLDEKTKFKLTKYLNNGTMTKVEEIMQDNGMIDTLPDLRKVIDAIRDRAIETGFEMGDILDYFPRVVSDVKGLMAELRQGKEWSAIDAAIHEIEKSKGEQLTEEQKAQVADLLLRGFPQGTINLSEPFTDPTHRKERKIKLLSDTMNQYYLPADKALMAYIHSINGAIENRKFFGKVKQEKELPLFGMQKEVIDSVGKLVMDLKNEGSIEADQEVVLKEILQAVFAPRKTGEITKAIKNTIYITTLSNVGSAITQFQDLALTADKLGYFKTVTALFEKKEIKKEDIGIGNIIQEFEQGGAAKALDRLLKITGFNAVDRLGKETLLQGTLDMAREQAKNGNKALTEKLERMFDKDAQSVINDLKNNINSYNVKFYLFNELSDIQPISILEVPEKYLTSNEGKLFYALKTYQLKLLDIYRNEIYNEIKSGNRKEGFKKLITLTSAMVLLGAGTDWLKDFLFNRKTELPDLVIDNILKLGGISKYTTWQARTEGGWKAFVNTVAPPLGIIDDILFKDTQRVYGKLTGGKEGEKDFQFTRYIPIGGKLYYWWFGEGHRKEENKTKTGQRRTTLERR